MNKISKFIGYRMLALIRKEFRQILRDRRLAISLILPPTLQLLLFGFALNATVSNLRLGVVDDSRTPESRELIANMTESRSFQSAGTCFNVTGVLGVLLILNGSLISSAAIVKEREAGTLEQLLMSPATTTQIIVAKLLPLFVLLCMMGTMAIVIMRVVFGIPFRGNVFLVISAAALCLLCGISIGTFIATFTRSARQAQLTLFFVNPPLTSLSGAFTPVEAMPKWLQPVAQFNPIQHFGMISRSAMFKGSGIETLWPHFLALLAFTTVLDSVI